MMVLLYVLLVRAEDKIKSHDFNLSSNRKIFSYVII